MAFEIKIPSLGESITEAILGTWLRKDGEAVSRDEPILELESDKANMELVAECAGTLKVLRPEGDTVAVGDIVAIIDENGTAPESAISTSKVAAAQSETIPPSRSLHRRRKLRQPPTPL